MLVNNNGTDHSWKIYTGIRSQKDVEKFIKEVGIDNISDAEWVLLLNTKCFSLDMLAKYKEYIDWEWACMTYTMTTQFMEKMQNYIDWGSVSYFQKLNYEFIKKFKNKLNLTKVLENTEGISGESAKIRDYINKLSKNKEEKEKWEKIHCNFIHCEREEEKKEIKKTNTEVIKEIDKKEETKKSKVKKIQKIEYETLNKSQLKEILEKRGIRVYYHDTIPILIQKCKESDKNDSSK